MNGRVVTNSVDGTLPGTDGVDPLGDWMSVLATLAPAGDDPGRIDQIRALENIKSGCAAAQARITAAFAASQRAHHTSGRGGEADRSMLRAGTPPGATRTGQAAHRRATAARLAARSAAGQIALARRDSPHRGGRHVGLADTLVHEMPRTLAALTAGTITEWRATIIARETACLTAEQRTAVDTEIADHLDGLGDARIGALVKSIAYRLDPEAATTRAVHAAADRRVSLRPAPDTMAYLTHLLPMAAAAACVASLQREADAHPGGDGRTRQQRMADLAVARLTGTANTAITVITAVTTPPAADTGTGTDATTAGSDGDDTQARNATGTGTADTGADDPVAAVRAAYQRAVRHDRQPEPERSRPTPSQEPAHRPAVEPGPHDVAPARQPVPDLGSGHRLPAGTDLTINLVITDRALFTDGDDPAILPGNHPIPAPLARRMLTDLPPQARVWIRRLYTRPGAGDLVAADSKRRIFPPGMRHLLLTRDQTCRTPWCNAPARHADHLVPFARGGATSIDNGQSLSEDCNYLRQAPGWAARKDPDRPGTIIVTTPTGHRYPSPPPDLIPGHTRRTPDAEVRYPDSILEIALLTRIG